MSKTKQQIIRFLDKIADKLPQVAEPEIYTDIHLHVSPDTGDLMAFNDEDQEITRCVIESWIKTEASPEDFYAEAEKMLRDVIDEHQPQLGIIKPYNYVLETENGEHIAELYIVDDTDTVILSTPFMKDLDKDLDDFINNLLKD